MVRYVCVATFGIAVASLLFCIRAGAAEQFGRLSVGAFTSTEKFTSNWDGAPENDAQNFTGRIYYRLFDMGTSRTEFVLDIRDNYDMFGALNLTQQELDAKNVLQARTLYVGNFPGKSSWNYEFGRFALNETGGTYTDGLVLQHRWSNAWRTGLFGGLNPLSEASQVVSSNPGATDFGFYTSYEPSDFRLVRNFFAHFAFVQNQFQSDVDRQYLYENLYYQWAPQSRILSTTYLDFVPNVKI